MPRLSKEEKESIINLSQEQLTEIVLKLAAKEQMVYDFILVNYLDKEEGELVLFDDVMFDIEMELTMRHKGFSKELQLANTLGACVRHINDFTKVCKNKLLEARLLMRLLEVPFAESTKLFGTCFSQYDTKVAIILRRVITLVTTKLHEDHRSEFVDTINKYLTILHGASNHLDTVYDLPKSI